MPNILAEFQDMMYRKALADKGFKYPPKGYFTCPHCGIIYLPIFSSKEQANQTDSLEAKEQWISHICTTKCWKEYLGLEFLDEWEEV